MKVIRSDFKKCNLSEVLAHNISKQRNLILIVDTNIVGTKL